ncbi:MAG: cytochrome C oxidase subunit IV family protein [Firmicutes bacterium]|jgi:cytochrome aa3 quinol oxidase subunit IV|nr:cytochrome C oxidase subunit IV family protein [Bacillota bacterium]
MAEKLQFQSEATARAHEGEDEGISALLPRFGEEKFPWIQVWGYIGSLVLTFAALILVIDHVLPPVALLSVILTLAVGQAALQIGVFMHVRESRGLAWQMVFLGLVLLMAVGMVGMSIWIMLFKSGVS